MSDLAISENEIRELFRNDDARALELIYDMLGGKIFGYVVSMVRSRADAEDIVQDLFVKIAERREKIATAGNIQAYVFSMARNLVMDFMRRCQKEKKMTTGDDYLLVRAEMDNAREYEKDLAGLQAALAGLPVEQREAVGMKYFQDMTLEEIAGLLGVSINTVASRCRYGLEKLKSAMQGTEKTNE